MAVASRFKKAVRSKARLRLGLDGPSNAGKSYTALRFAFSFPEPNVAFIEAGENASALLYTGEAPDGVPFDFAHTEIKGDYAPSRYTEAIEDAGREGFNIIIVDSLTHAWTGIGGALDQVGAAGFTDKDGWRKVTPQHNRMIDAILQSPAHVICTIRSKVEHVVEEDERGRKSVKKLGLKPIQREGMEYEFTVFGSLDQSHTMTITKSRCKYIDNAVVNRPGAHFLAPVIRWLEEGSEPDPATIVKRASADQIHEIERLRAALKVAPAAFKKRLAQLYQTESPGLLLESQAADLIAAMSAKVATTEEAKNNEEENPSER